MMTKEVVALMVGVGLVLFTLIKYETKKYSGRFTLALIPIVILGALVIANYTRLDKLKGLGFEAEMQKLDVRDMEAAKVDAKQNSNANIYKAVSEAYEGNKQSYNALVGANAIAIDSSIKTDLDRFIHDIQKAYTMTEKTVRTIPLCKPHINCAELENEESEKLDNIYSEFTEEALMVARAKAAYLLRFTTNKKIDNTNRAEAPMSWEKIITALVNAMNSPTEHLIVSKTALDSFRHLIPEFETISPAPTTNNPETVFDFDKAGEYWRTNKQAILRHLTR